MKIMETEKIGKDFYFKGGSFPYCIAETEPNSFVLRYDGVYAGSVDEITTEGFEFSHYICGHKIEGFVKWSDCKFVMEKEKYINKNFKFKNDTFSYCIIETEPNSFVLAYDGTYMGTIDEITTEGFSFFTYIFGHKNGGSIKWSDCKFVKQ